MADPMVLSTWVKLVSWHLVTAPGRTRCGRNTGYRKVADDLPLGERSCETCLRLAAHDAEKAAA